MKDKDYAEPDELSKWRNRIISAVHYEGPDDSEDVISILKNFAKQVRHQTIRENEESLKDQVDPNKYPFGEEQPWDVY